MFTKVFLIALLNRGITGAAAAVLLAVGGGSLAAADGNTNVNAFLLDWAVLGGSALGGFMIHVLLGITAQGMQANGPGFGNSEVLNPAQVKAETGVTPRPIDYVVDPDGPRDLG